MSGRRLVVAAFAAFVVLGLVDGAIGPVWPDLRDEFGRSDAAFGWIFGALAVGYLVASAVSGHVMARLGAGTTVVIGAVVNVVAYAILATSPVFAAVPIGFVLGGLGSGLLDPTVNAWVALRHGAREMGLLHAFYGLGAVVGPLVATAFIAGFGVWRGAYVAVFVVQVIVLIALVPLRDGFDVADAETDRRFTAPPPSVRVRVVSAGLLGWSALYVGMEVGYGAWAFTVLTDERGVGDVAAGMATAGFWAGLMVGRFALAAIGDRIDADRLMAGSIATSVLGAVWFSVDTTAAGTVALVVLGLAMAAMFPVAVAMIPALLGAARARLVVGYQFAAAAVGAIVLPALVGVVADEAGLGRAPWVLLAAVVGAAATWFGVVALSRTVRSGDELHAG